jgi:hypothetical protein
MSDATKQAEQATLPSPEDAYQHLLSDVHGQVFFGKLAQHGFTPKTEKEANDLLELAGKLRAVQEDPRTKQAAEANSPYSQANAALDQALGQSGFKKQASAQEQDLALDQAAQKAASDPDIYNSILSLKAAEAQGIREQMGLVDSNA